MGFHVREVWNHNLAEEISAMEDSLRHYPIVSIDSEFPGCLRPTPRHAGEEVRFADMKFNVDSTDLIQLGVTLSDEKGTVAGIWQFNLEFDLDRDLHAKESILFLKSHGVDFEKLRSHGIERIRFGAAFGGLIRRRSRPLTWVTFHGLYDLAYVVKVVGRRPIPDTAAEFGNVMGKGFDAVVDVKYVARYLEGGAAVAGGEVGLQRLADELGVKRRGEAHTAGSDSLLTALVYSKLKKKVKHVVGLDSYVDFVYGISGRISRQSVAVGTTPPMVIPFGNCRLPVYRIAVPVPVPVPVVYRSCRPQFPIHYQHRRNVPPRLSAGMGYLAAV
ncbi:unnamed protein product [Linum tenue]|uniref:poly(A)-specific ribonuclease n=3 Tax=Linum tenue TaxID=586396 RepID=A0AAV0MWX9_9ROSI|nr:unnamed protein product [Linum tenue]